MGWAPALIPEKSRGRNSIPKKPVEKAGEIDFNPEHWIPAPEKSSMNRRPEMVSVSELVFTRHLFPSRRQRIGGHIQQIQ